MRPTLPHRGTRRRRNATLACALSLLTTDSSSAQTCTLSWNDPVSGLFSEAARWTASPGAPSGCQGRAPRDGDSVAFRPGQFEVSIPGVYRLVVTEFDVGSLPADITFGVGGSLTTRVLATSGRLTVAGSGELLVSELVNLGGDASLVFDGVKATLGAISASAPGPSDLSRQILVRQGGILTTLSGTVPGTTVDGGTWRHQGPANAVADITLSNGGRFEAVALDLRSSRLVAGGGSLAEVGDFKTTSDVVIREGSRMANRQATLSFGDQLVSGTGSQWTITETLSIPAAAQVICSNRAELIIHRVVFSDPAGFAALHARGTDARVRVQTPLVLLAGNVVASDGGVVTVPSVEVGGSRSVRIGRGNLGLSGARFECSGEMTLGSNGAGTVTVTGGGRASARSVSIGFPASPGFLDVDAAAGTAHFDVTEQMVVGQDGQGTVRISNGGRLQLTGPSGGVVVTPEAGGDGEVVVTGTDSTLDLGRGYIHVGRGGPGRLSVSGGGTLLGSGFNLGDRLTPGIRSALVTGSSSSVRLREGSAYVGNATLRLVNGGFFQIGSEAVEGSLTLEALAVVSLVNGSLEIGNTGGAPGGIVRVNRGVLRGGGIIQANSVEVIAQGRCQPGLLSEGDNVMRIQGGSYLQDANGTLEIDVVTTAAGLRALTLEVDRSVSLNGNLIVNFLGDPPRAGDQIGFIRFGEGLTGAFSSVALRGLATGVTFEQRVLSPGVYGLAFTSEGTTAGCGDPPPRIQSLDVSVPGRITFTIAAGICGIHRLEYSPDLIAWREVRSFTGSASGPVSVTIVPPAPAPFNCFRVVRW